MHVYVRRALQTALVTGGLVAAGASMAHAEEPVPDPALVVDVQLGDPGHVHRDRDRRLDDCSAGGVRCGRRGGCRRRGRRRADEGVPEHGHRDAAFR